MDKEIKKARKMKTYHLNDALTVIYLDRQGTQFENDTVMKYTGKIGRAHV